MHPLVWRYTKRPVLSFDKTTNFPKTRLRRLRLYFIESQQSLQWYHTHGQNAITHVELQDRATSHDSDNTIPLCMETSVTYRTALVALLIHPPVTQAQARNHEHQKSDSLGYSYYTYFPYLVQYPPGQLAEHRVFTVSVVCPRPPR